MHLEEGGVSYVCVPPPPVFEGATKRAPCLSYCTDMRASPVPPVEDWRLVTRAPKTPYLPIAGTDRQAPFCTYLPICSILYLTAVTMTQPA